MTNKRELQIMHKYQKDGWVAVRCGAPDWLFVKMDGNKINDVKFVEVKSPNDKLKIEQHLWRKVIKDFLNCKYKVEIVD